MKKIILFATIVLISCSDIITAQEKTIVLESDSQNQRNVRQNSSTPAPKPLPGKTAETKKKDTVPSGNSRIAVSDSGNPADKKNAARRKAAANPSGTKKSNTTGITPK